MLKDVDVILMRIEEELPIDDKIQLVETFDEFKSATGFTCFEALQSIVLNQLLCYGVQTKAGHMYDEL